MNTKTFDNFCHGAPKPREEGAKFFVPLTPHEGQKRPVYGFPQVRQIFCPFVAAPQKLQKVASSGINFPQKGHAFFPSRRFPHRAQNTHPSSFSFPQFGQIIESSSLSQPRKQTASQNENQKNERRTRTDRDECADPRALRAIGINILPYKK